MAQGHLLLILHAHLPYVRHPEYDRFLEERWFFEAVVETYIPLIKFFDQLRRENNPFRLTLSISPPLANMMEDPLLQQRCLRHLDLSVQLATREIERTKDWPDVNALSRMYLRLFEEARQIFTERCGLQLVRAFKELAAAGHIELMTCAGTHGFLPLLRAEPGTVRAQVFTAVQEHQRIFGQPPAGMWIPECGYYPGLDELLREAQLRYFVVDSHAIDHAQPRPLFGVAAPVYTPAGVAAFARHPTTSKLVWSSIIGYPADFSYREYYRDIGFELDAEYLAPYQYAEGVRSHTGIKYHRVTGQGDYKELYHPDTASETTRRHARDFVQRCKAEVKRATSGMPFPSVIVSPYDAELFGHWWFEGPQWIYHVFRELTWCADELTPSTPGQYLDEHPIQQKCTPASSSWGKKGYSEHWINPKTEWLWQPLHEAASRMRQAVLNHTGCIAGSLPDRMLRQAGRELMLAQASDWPFIITNGTTEQYARRRFHDHIHRCHWLLDALEQQQIDPNKLAALEHMDAIFPELDYRLFAT